MTSPDLKQRSYEFGMMVEQVPSTCVGAVAGLAYTAKRLDNRTYYIYDYLKNNGLKEDKFTRKTVEKELVKAKKISPKLKTAVGAFLLPFVGCISLYEGFKRTLFK